MKRQIFLIKDFKNKIQEFSNYPDLPIASAIYHKDTMIAFASNQKEQHNISFYHSEILCIEQASKVLNTWRLNECTLISSLHPCDLCLEAIKESRIEKVFFLAYRKERIIKKYPFLLCGGFYHTEEEKRLKKFFQKIRKESCPSGLRSMLGKHV